MIICLCGSTRFKKEFLKVAEKETLKGNIVLMPGVFGHSDGVRLTEEDKKELDELHIEKIKMCDKVIVVTKGKYIGKSTAKEIKKAELLGKEIEYISFTGRCTNYDIDYELLYKIADYSCDNDICFYGNFDEYITENCETCKINRQLNLLREKSDERKNSAL